MKTFLLKVKKKFALKMPLVLTMALSHQLYLAETQPSHFQMEMDQPINFYKQMDSVYYPGQMDFHLPQLQITRSLELTIQQATFKRVESRLMIPMPLVVLQLSH